MEVEDLHTEEITEEKTMIKELENIKSGEQEAIGAKTEIRNSGGNRLNSNWTRKSTNILEKKMKQKRKSWTNRSTTILERKTRTKIKNWMKSWKNISRRRRRETISQKMIKIKRKFLKRMNNKKYNSDY